MFAIIIIIGVGGYFLLQPQDASAPATPAPSAVVKTSTTETSQKPPANVGAAGVYDPNAPKGSAAECVQCDQYNGSQKAQCLVALHC